MRNPFRKEVITPIDPLIEDILSRMQQLGVTSEEYPKLMTLLERLYKLKKTQNREPLSRDTIAMVGGNLMGILLIVAYEQKHVMTSKGFNHLIRPK